MESSVLCPIRAHHSSATNSLLVSKLLPAAVKKIALWFRIQVVSLDVCAIVTSHYELYDVTVDIFICLYIVRDVLREPAGVLWRPHCLVGTRWRIWQVVFVGIIRSMFMTNIGIRTLVSRVLSSRFDTSITFAICKLCRWKREHKGTKLFWFQKNNLFEVAVWCVKTYDIAHVWESDRTEAWQSIGYYCSLFVFSWNKMKLLIGLLESLKR